MAGVAWETALTIVADAAVELGLVSSLTDAWGSTDQNVVLLRSLCTSIGRDLLTRNSWSHLKKETSIATAAADYQYDLPADFSRVVDDTFWNRTQTLKLGGPIDSIAWQYLKATSASGTPRQWFRIVANEVEIYPTPTAIESIYYEYVSSYWVKESGQSAPNTDRVDANTDTIYFEPLLFMRALKVKFLRQKGMDTGAAQEDFEERWAQVASQEGGAPVLSIAPRDTDGLLDGTNVPDSGYGS